jgi:hypothetical protein
MAYRAEVAVGIEMHAYHINKFCGQKVKFIDIKPYGT